MSTLRPNRRLERRSAPAKPVPAGPDLPQQILTAPTAGRRGEEEAGPGYLSTASQAGQQATWCWRCPPACCSCRRVRLSVLSAVGCAYHTQLCELPVPSVCACNRRRQAAPGRQAGPRAEAIRVTITNQTVSTTMHVNMQVSALAQFPHLQQHLSCCLCRQCPRSKGCLCLSAS